jgi:predicted aconitase with swiveling domain
MTETTVPGVEGRARIELTGKAIPGRTLCAGSARGMVLALSVPLSFWGGVDHDGVIVDSHHPDVGTSVRGTVLAMRSGRGSSSSSSVLAELIRNGNAPAAIVLAEPDGIVALGAMAAAELYDVWCPVVQVTESVLATLRTGLTATVSAEPSTTTRQENR